MSDAIAAFLAVALAIVGLAFIAVVLSKNAQTPDVIKALGASFGGAIQAAVAPIGAGNPGNFGGAGY